MNITKRTGKIRTIRMALLATSKFKTLKRREMEADAIIGHILSSSKPNATLRTLSRLASNEVSI